MGMRDLQGCGRVVDDVGTEGEDGAVEEVEDRHVAPAAVVVSGVRAAARTRLPGTGRARRCETRRVIGLEEADPIELK